ncbi:hypothetical protein BDW71DRAFT_181283 [Aspergillus fruticulosus]
MDNPRFCLGGLHAGWLRIFYALLCDSASSGWKSKGESLGAILMVFLLNRSHKHAELEPPIVYRRFGMFGAVGIGFLTTMAMS